MRGTSGDCMWKLTKLLCKMYVRQTSVECVHLDMHDQFRSQDKDGGHTIRSAISENPMLHANFTALCYRSGVIADEIFTLQKWNFLCLFATATLILTQWPSYMNLINISWRCRRWAKINLLCQGFQKLSSDRQTDTTEIIYHNTFWVVKNRVHCKLIFTFKRFDCKSDVNWHEVSG